MHGLTYSFLPTHKKGPLIAPSYNVAIELARLKVTQLISNRVCVLSTFAYLVPSMRTLTSKAAAKQSKKKIPGQAFGAVLPISP